MEREKSYTDISAFSENLENKKKYMIKSKKIIIF